jgi:cyanophycinase
MNISISDAGKLIVIGGNLQSEAIFKKIIYIAGGEDKAKIAIIPAGSYTPVKTGEAFIQKFIQNDLPAKNIKMFPIAVINDETTPEDESKWIENSKDQSIVKELRTYNCVFFVGGNQLRYIKALISPDGEDLPVMKVIREIYQMGGVLVGTSAGAAVLSEVMMGGGDSYGGTVQGIIYNKEEWSDNPSDSRLLLTKGFGFIENAITDTHFVKRGRLGRLLAACLAKGKIFGYGIGEDTALVIYGNTAEVVGSGGVLITDTSKAELIQNKPEEGLLYAKNIKIHYLEHKDRLNLEQIKFYINRDKTSPIETPEYDQTEYGISTDIFNEYRIKHKITKDLVDNQAVEGFGIAINETIGEDVNPDLEERDGDRHKIAYTTLLRFRQEGDTLGYQGQIDIDKDHLEEKSYSVLNVYVDIFPLKAVRDAECSDSGLALIMFPEKEGIELRVFDYKKDGQVIEGATIKLKTDDKDERTLQEVRTDEYGKVLLNINHNIDQYRFDIYRNISEDNERYMIVDHITNSEYISYSPDMNGIYCYVP